MIDILVKKNCVEMSAAGKSSKEIYLEYYQPRYPNTSLESFRRALRLWKKKTWADEDILNAGTYPNFVPYNATVQVNSKGEISQVWVRQSAEDHFYDDLVAAIKKNTTPVFVEPIDSEEVSGMLEIPLYDMHFPLAKYDEQLNEILNIICSKYYEEINIVIGQDMFHNDDFRGRTSSGRPIEKVDIAEAWEICKYFWYNIIDKSLHHAKKVNLIYSKGNHDESLAWAFVQMLKVAFPDIHVDDSMRPRKSIYWKGNFIGISHGCNRLSGNQELRSQFTIEFSEEFAQAKVREIHVGHLHHEKEGDLYGVMIRRIPTAVPTDTWSEDMGYVGHHMRFVLFEYVPNKLKAIHYI